MFVYIFVLLFYFFIFLFDFDGPGKDEKRHENALTDETEQIPLRFCLSMSCLKLFDLTKWNEMDFQLSIIIPRWGF